MLLVFGYLYVCYGFFSFFFKKQKIIDSKNASWPKSCNTAFLFLLKAGSAWPVYQQINHVLP